MWTVKTKRVGAPKGSAHLLQVSRIRVTVRIEEFVLTQLIFALVFYALNVAHV